MDSARKALLAEDDPHMRSLLTAALEREGFEVVSVADGLALMDQIHSRLEQNGQLHLIVSDIHMPRCSGLMALSTLRRMNLQIPVLLITAFGDDDTHAQARSLGATILDKPFDIYRFRDLAAGIASH